MEGKGEEKKTKKRKLEISDAERKRRSELAKKLAREGKIGGVQKGAGRPKKPRAQEVVAEKVRNEANNIYQALKSALNSDQPATRLKAALSMLEIENAEVQHKLKEEQRKYDNLSRDKLLELIQERVMQLGQAGVKIPGFDFESEAREITNAPKELNA